MRIKKVLKKYGRTNLYKSFILLSLAIILLKESKLDNYNFYCLLLFPSTICSFLWIVTKTNLKKRIQEVVIFTLVAFCFWGNFTLKGIGTPIVSGACTLILWEIINRLK
jgi:hypothetical protein